MIDFDTNAMPVLGPASMRYHWDGTDAALPAWLTTFPTTPGAVAGDIGVGATYTMQNPLTQTPGLFMSTAPAASRSAIVSGPQVDLSRIRAARFRLRFDTGNEGTSVGILHIGLCQPGNVVSSGVRFGKFRMDAAYQPTLIGVTAASTTKYVQSRFPYFQNAKRYDVSLLLDCKDKDVYLMMDDTVVDIWPGVGGDLELGVVQPTLRLANDSSNTPSRNVILRSFTFERWE